jgi:hypothetical protein
MSTEPPENDTVAPERPISGVAWRLDSGVSLSASLSAAGSHPAAIVQASTGTRTTDDARRMRSAYSQAGRT